MAEFLNWKTQKNKVVPGPVPEGMDGFNAMGKPVPMYRRTNAIKHCKAMGMTDIGRIMHCVDGMSLHLERDQPYEAMAAGMKYVDLTGTYRLMAVLLTGDPPDQQDTAMG